MTHKYIYPAIDQELRNFLVFVLLLFVVVAVAAAIGSVSGIDTAAIDAQTMEPDPAVRMNSNSLSDVIL